MNSRNDSGKDRVIVITGSNSGIGKAAALRLARAGAVVVMVCRNPVTGAAAQREIVAASGNRTVDLMLCDLSSQASIRAFAEAFTARYTRLDALINNAANFDHSLKHATRTADGIETIFATNHLGPFLMTHLLLDTLRQSAPARILNVASKGLVSMPWLEIEFDNLNGEKKFSTTHAYYQSKLAQIMFTYALAERLQGTGVTVHCSRVTNVQVDMARLADLNPAMRWAYALKRRLALTPEQMAESYVRLVTDPEFEKVSGKYWDENCREVRSSGKSYDRAVWEKLWQVSAAAVHLDAVPARAFA